MTDSMYLIIESVKEFKKFLKPFVGDSDIALELVGEKESRHITARGHAKTSDGKYLFEIPRTLLELQKKILASPHADRLIKRENIKNYTLKTSFPYGVG